MAEDLNNGMKCVKQGLMLNCYPKWMIQKQQQQKHNGFHYFMSKVMLPYTTDLGGSLKRLLEKHRKRTIFKPAIKPSTVLSLGKDIVPASRDGFRERGALGHLSFWGPTQVCPIWLFL